MDEWKPLRISVATATTGMRGNSTVDTHSLAMRPWRRKTAAGLPALLGREKGQFDLTESPKLPYVANLNFRQSETYNNLAHG